MNNKILFKHINQVQIQDIGENPIGSIYSDQSIDLLAVIDHAYRLTSFLNETETVNLIDTDFNNELRESKLTTRRFRYVERKKHYDVKVNIQHNGISRLDLFIEELEKTNSIEELIETILKYYNTIGILINIEQI